MAQITHTFDLALQIYALAREVNNRDDFIEEVMDILAERDKRILEPYITRLLDLDTKLNIANLTVKSLTEEREQRRGRA